MVNRCLALSFNFCSLRLQRAGAQRVAPGRTRVDLVAWIVNMKFLRAACNQNWRDLRLADRLRQAPVTVSLSLLSQDGRWFKTLPVITNFMLKQSLEIGL